MSFLRPFSLLSTLLGASVALGSETSAPPAHDEPVALDQLIVTGSAFAKAQAELAQSTAVVGGRSLALRAAGSLGETLSGETGIVTTWFGPGASRPVIRGIGGDRVLILENGLGTFDASNVSPDHATSLEPLFVERIEVVRGPATLRHGNAAIGGVVNAFDGRVPEKRAGHDLAAAVDARAGGADNERAGAVKLSGDAGPFTWQARAFRRRTSDTSTAGPNFAPTLAAGAEDPNFRHDSIPNSNLDSKGGSFGASGFAGDVRLGAAFTGYDTNYGVPLAPEGGEDEEGPVRIRLRQRRVDAVALIERPWGWFTGARLDLGGSRYSHTELAGGEVGTRFTQRAQEARLALPQRAVGQLTGEFGAQYRFTDLHAEGDEAFLPPVETTNVAAFVSEELAVGRLTLQGGARLERQRSVPDAASGRPRRTHTPVSISFGAVWALDDDWGLAVSAARTRRAPSATELFAEGPHAGTRAFEIGDPSLGTERARSLEVSLRRRAGFVTGVTSVFTNRFSNYLFETPTGGVTDGLPEYRFVARAVNFEGAELETWWHLHERGEGRAHATVTSWVTVPGRIDVKLAADLVRATERSTGAPLPRIPAARALAALRYTHGNFAGGVSATRSFAQKRTAPGESATAAFTLLDADASWRFGGDDDVNRRGVSDAGSGGAPRESRAARGAGWFLFLRGTNLTNTEARNHVSFLKDIAPLPGRGISAGLRARF